MPKKKPAGDVGINMDVMMDSMTNVVGTLLLILIVVQIQISTAVETIETVLKNITKKDLTMLKSKIAEQNKNIENVDVSSLNEDYKDAMADVDEAQLRVSIYADKAEKTKSGLLDVRELIEMKAEHGETKEFEMNIFRELSVERQRLEAALAKTPKPKIPAGADIVVPAGLSIPKKPKYIKMLARYDRLYFMQDGDYKKLAEQMMEPRMSSMVYSNYIDPKTKRTTTIYDHKKTSALLQTICTNLALGNTNLNFKTHIRDYDSWVYLHLDPKADAGFTIDELKERTNMLRKQFVQLRRDPANVVWFYVYKDSLESYLAGRDVAQSIGMPNGWEFYRWGGFAPRLKFRVQPLKVRPPPKITKVEGRKKNSAIQIAGPKKSLD